MAQQRLSAPTLTADERVQRVPVISRFADTATFGEFLRNHREQRRLTLRQIADSTRLPLRQLSALERGDIDSWPGGFYRRARIRTYTEAIGLDAEEMVREFVQLDADTNATREAVTPAAEHPRVPAARAGRLTMAASVWIVSGVVVAWTLAWYAQSGNADPVPSDQAITSREALRPPAAVEATSGLVTTAVPSTPALDRQSPVVAEEMHLVVISNPAGARVTVNGIGWGPTPVTIRYLPPGEKDVRITKPGYQTLERRVALTADRPVQTLRVNLQTQPGT